MRKLLFLLIALFLITVNIMAQSIVLTTGGSVSGNGGTVDYSVGQLVYLAHINVNGSVAEGVQQPYEFSVVNTIEEAKGINLSVLAYPNPTTSCLILETKATELTILFFQLLDMNGKLLQSEKITGNQTIIDMGNLMPANYLLKVIQNENVVKTFKVIKN